MNTKLQLWVQYIIFLIVFMFICCYSYEECSNIKFLDESRRTPTRAEVLKKICLVGLEHVSLDDIKKQFAIFILVRDSFDADVKWISGDAEDIISNTSFWTVNDIVKLNISQYHWYKYGYPMYPLPYQAMPSEYSPEKDSKQKWWQVFKKNENWPNYGIATPVYFASNSWRNPMWSLEEFIQEEERKQHDHKINKKQDKSYLLNPSKFKAIGKDLLEKVNPQNVESYNSWPFLDHSLIAMVQSSVRRNKGLCPDDLYIFYRITPCQPQEKSQLSCSSSAVRATTLLTSAQCRTTNVIVGYAHEYMNNAL